MLGVCLGHQAIADRRPVPGRPEPRSHRHGYDLSTVTYSGGEAI